MNFNTIKTKVAGGIVLNQDQKVAVVNQNGNSWSLPKGHIEKQESAIIAAKREIAEETGLKSIEFVKSLGSYQRYRIGLNGLDDKSELKNIEMFLFKCFHEGNLKPIDPANPFALWLPVKKVEKYLTHKEDKLFFKKSLEQLFS